MKRNTTIFALLACAAILFSCAKDPEISDVAPQNEPSQEQTGPQDEIPAPEDETPGENPGTPGLDPSEYLLSFGVSFENDTEDEAESAPTKVNIDLNEGTVAFTGGEAVLVRSGDDTGKYIYDATEKIFVPEDESQAIHIAEDIEVYYPFDRFVLNGEDIVFTMPNLVNVSDADDLANKNAMTGIIVNKENTMTAMFKNLGAIISLNFVSKYAAGETLTAVELEAGDGVKLTGSSTVTWSGTGETAVPVLGALDGAADVRIDLGTPVQLTPSTAETFFFFLPPGDYDITIRAIFGKTGGYEPFNQVVRAKGNKPVERNNLLKVSGLKLPGFFSGGDGTPASPYLISTADDFKRISTLANATAVDGGNGFNTEAGRTFFGSAVYQQTADISFGDETISSIGTYSTAPFKGVYDGKNNTLSDFKVVGTSESSTGLFEYLEDANIKNLNISGSTVTGADAVGTLAGRCIGSTLIENCSLNKDAASSQCIVQGANAVGGLVAHLTGTASVTGCSINGTVVLATAPDKGASNSNNQGGIIGYSGSTGEISNCTTAGTITFTNESAGKTGVNRGGIIGNLSAEASILSCTNGASFSTTMNQVGGIAGVAQGSAIIGSEEAPCYNTAAITGADQTGGIVGHLEAKVQHVTNSGTVTGVEAVGGLVGYVSSNGVLQYSHNITGGDVEGATNVGGIAGTVGHASASVTTASTVMNCRVDGVKVTATNEEGSAAGGIAGLVRLGARVRGCSAFRGEVSGHQDVGGCIGLLYWYNIKNTNNNARILVSENIVGMDVIGLDPINNTARIGGFLGWFRGAQGTWTSGKNTYKPYIFVYQNGVVDGKITAENCEYVGSFVGYLGTSLDTYRIYDSYSLIDDSNFNVTKTNSNIGGFFGGKGGTIGVNRDYFVVSQNTSAAVTGITKIDDASDITNQTLSNNSPTLGSQVTLGGWSNQGDVAYPVPTLLVDFGYYK